MKDELFLRGENVPMTKEAVRALALSKLELHRASHLIDVGAGTGSVSIEAALQFPSLQVTAIERNPAALRLLDENRQRFACGNIDILPGEAPMTITGKADAVFMGGSGGHLTALIDWAMGHLHPGGRLACRAGGKNVAGARTARGGGDSTLQRTGVRRWRNFRTVWAVQR